MLMWHHMWLKVFLKTLVAKCINGWQRIVIAFCDRNHHVAKHIHQRRRESLHFTVFLFGQMYNDIFGRGQRHLLRVRTN